jgi:hypothetical protein
LRNSASGNLAAEFNFNFARFQDERKLSFKVDVKETLLFNDGKLFCLLKGNFFCDRHKNISFYKIVETCTGNCPLGEGHENIPLQYYKTSLFLE